jgi:hypothetical protein
MVPEPMIVRPRIFRDPRLSLSAWALSLAVAWLLAGVPVPALGPRPSGAAITIPLEPLGYEPPQVRYLTAGATMFTLNFVDAKHLLLTFNTHTLMARLPDEPADDDDRIVAALLLELPSGNILARTTWRMHDHDRYLWPLGHGRFLLRQRTALSVLAPLDGMTDGDAFHETPFVDVKRRVGHITISPEGDLLAIQTIPPPEPPLFGAAASAAALAATVPGYKKPEPAVRPDPAVRISIYRLHYETQPNGREHLFARQAGLIRAGQVIHIAATGEGYLNTMKQTDGTYAFDFVTHDGKKIELPAYITSCLPRAYFLSSSEFVAFGCRSSEDKPEFSEFDLRGQQAWISNAPGTIFAPYIDPAPRAGRFAYSHVTITGTYFDPENVTAEELGAQEVTVYQNHDGRSLLKVQTTPVQRAGQNFDLSADGLQLAIVRDGKIEIYNLPELTGKDKAEMKLVAAAVPPRNDGPVLLNSVAVAPAQATPAVTIATTPSAAAKSSTVPDLPGEQSTASPVAPAEQNVVGDVPPNGPRKPPSLYGPGYPK